MRTTELVKVTHTGDCLRMRSWLALVCAAVAAGSFLTDVSTQPEALDLLASSEHTVTEPDVLLALERGWWDAAKQMLRTMRKAGHAVGTMQDVRGAATRIRDQATDIINLMRVGANAEETVVNAAFQWAQRPEFIYLNVKFASRIDGPVTCLNVDNEKVTLTNNSLLFEAVGRQKPKTFRLNLTFNKEIDPEASTWSFASVGRISFTIAKKDHGEHPPRAPFPLLVPTTRTAKNLSPGWALAHSYGLLGDRHASSCCRDLASAARVEAEAEEHVLVVRPPDCTG